MLNLGLMAWIYDATRECWYYEGEWVAEAALADILSKKWRVEPEITANYLAETRARMQPLPGLAFKRSVKGQR